MEQIKTLKQLINEKTGNKDITKLQNYILKNENKIDELVINDIKLILLNDYKITNQLENTITEFAKKKIKQNKLNQFLLMKLTKNLIDNILNLRYFQNTYFYTKNNINVVSRYILAYNINKTILLDL